MSNPLAYVILRPVLEGDATELFPQVYESPVTDTLLWDGPDSLDQFRDRLAQRAESTLRGETHNFTIVLQPSGDLIGSCSIRPIAHPFRADVGIWVGKDYQGHGYGTQAVGQLLHYGFEKLKMEKIEALVFESNWASRRIFEKNGFQLEGTIRKAVLKRGVYVNNWVLGIQREDWLKEIEAQPERASELIVHILPRADRQKALATGEYRAASLEREGFMHASLPGQILAVANTFYRQVPDMLLLWIDPSRLRAALRWEAVGEQVFPHLYGALNLEAVVRVDEFPQDDDGVYRRLEAKP